MRLEDLLKEVPELENYIHYMPEELYKRHTIRVYPPGTIIHQKDYPLTSFGIIAKGEHRVINEIENGNVYMIEKNEPIDFVGPEKTLKSGSKKTFIFSSLSLTKLHINFTVLPIIGAHGFFIRRILSFLTIF